jgi:ferredoxin/flavodoxin---NADP+ reductase
MRGKTQDRPTVLIIGAGPAGLFTAQELSDDDAQVIILNRDVKPGGLAEYGIYHSKHRIKSGLRRQFRKILDDEAIHYYGNVTVGEDKDLTLDALREMGFDAIVVAVGAQGTKWLSIEGESLDGVYHAKDLIYYYNDLPPFSERSYPIGDRVALVGVGNVMADIAHWLVRDVKVDAVIAVARRGPAEVKFTPRELAYSAASLDLEALDAEIERVRDRMEAVGQDPEAAKALILSALERAPAPVSDTRLRFRFLSAIGRILGDGEGNVAGLEVEDTRLVWDEERGRTYPDRLGTRHVLDVDTVIFCIGDRVSEGLGLPVENFSYCKHPAPEHPVDGICYEAYDPTTEEALKRVFLVGWAREASAGQVGLARKDAKRCVEAVKTYLDAARAQDSGDTDPLGSLKRHLDALDHPVVDKADWHRLKVAEAEEAERRNEEHFKYESNDAMLAAIGKG